MVQWGISYFSLIFDLTIHFQLIELYNCNRVMFLNQYRTYASDLYALVFLWNIDWT